MVSYLYVCYYCNKFKESSKIKAVVGLRERSYTSIGQASSSLTGENDMTYICVDCVESKK